MKLSKADAARYCARPDPERPDAALLRAWLDAQGLAPRYAMGRLA